MHVDFRPSFLNSSFYHHHPPILLSICSSIPHLSTFDDVTVVHTKKSLPLPVVVLELLRLLDLHVDDVEVHPLPQAGDVVEGLYLPHTRNTDPKSGAPEPRF